MVTSNTSSCGRLNFLAAVIVSQQAVVCSLVTDCTAFSCFVSDADFGTCGHTSFNFLHLLSWHANQKLPFIHCHPETGHNGRRLSRVFQTSSSPATFSSSSWGILRLSPDQMRDIILPVSSTTGSCPSWTCPEFHHRKALQEACQSHVQTT